jgi:heat-inducible transcriptional repressor
MVSPHPRTPQLGYRARRILSAVVSEYIATGEPVGSRTLSKRFGLNLSPATIRNELADLEEAGCLLQPHTSAGRVPSELGFRIFIDALAQLREVGAEDRQAVLERMRQLRPGVDDVVREAGRVLAQLTGAAALVTRPRTDVEPIRELRFMPIRERTLVAVIVTKSGSVENRILEVAAAPTDVELERIHHLLAEVVQGRTLADARAQLVARMQTERGEYDALKVRAKEMLDGVTRSADGRDVIIEGQGLLFDRPEFADPEKIRGFVRAFEDKEQLLELLERTMGSGGVQVLVGSETNLPQVPDVGMISADYRTGGVQAGSVGIIGPTRLDYAKLMPLVAFTADVVGEALDGGSKSGDDDE